MSQLGPKTYFVWFGNWLHPGNMPPYLTSNFHSPVSLLNVVSLRSSQPEEGWDKTCPWLSQVVLLKLQGSWPDLL